MQRGEGTKRMKMCLNLRERFMKHGRRNDEGDGVHAYHIQDHDDDDDDHHHHHHHHHHYDEFD